MTYGDNSKAYQVLKTNTLHTYPNAIEGTTIKFEDGSFIEVRKFDNHQAFLATGWNVTPR